MDLLREFVPFFIGGFLPPLFMLVINKLWSGQRKFLYVCVPSLVLGVSTAMVMGELAFGFQAGATAVLIDSSTLFLGTQLGYHLVWKPLLAMLTQPGKSSQRVS